MRSKEREQQTRIEDLEGAMKAVGDLLGDESTPVKRRIDMALGILWRYDAAKKPHGRTDG